MNREIPLDNELAAKYGSYASYQTENDPYLVEMWGENPADEVDRLLDRFCTSDATVLDLGCGAGMTLCRLAPNVKHIWGFEQEPELLNGTTQRVAARKLQNVTLVLGNVAEDGDVDQLPNNQFDVMLSRRGPDVTPKLGEKLRDGAIVIQELYREPLGIRELFGRKPFLPQAGSDPHWLLEQYKWLGLLPVSIKDYFFEQYFQTADAFANYLQYAGLLSHWRMPKIPFTPELDSDALALYVRYNTTDKGVRLFSQRTVYLFRKTAVSHYPALPETKPLYI